MALKGNIDTFFLGSIFQLLRNDKKTGTFNISDGHHEVTVIIKEGTIVYAMSSKRESRLGNMLLDKGEVSLEQLELCLTIGKERKQALGKVLVDQEYISLEHLQMYVQKQSKEIIYDLFNWKKGEFVYEDAQLNLSGIVITQLDIMSVLIEVSQRIDEMSVLEKLIPNDTMVFQLTEKILEEAERKLVTAEWKILSVIDGKSTVKQIIEEGEWDKFTVYKKLHVLRSSGLIEAVEKELPEEKKREDYYSDIITGYNSVLQVIFKRLEPELGRETFAIFEKNRREANPIQLGLFDHYHPNNTVATNILVIRDELKNIKDKEEGHVILVEGFNRLVSFILEGVLEILGIKTTKDVMQEVEKVLPNLAKYQTGLEGKTGIVDDMKTIIARVEQRIGDKGKRKQKSGRLSSLFSKK
jgi:dihydrofolate reductase